MLVWSVFCNGRHPYEILHECTTVSVTLNQERVESIQGSPVDFGESIAADVNSHTLEITQDSSQWGSLHDNLADINAKLENMKHRVDFAELACSSLSERLNPSEMMVLRGTLLHTLSEHPEERSLIEALLFLKPGVELKQYVLSLVLETMIAF
jgi:hypothetical protein